MSRLVSDIVIDEGQSEKDPQMFLVMVHNSCGIPIDFFIGLTKDGSFCNREMGVKNTPRLGTIIVNSLLLNCQGQISAHSMHRAEGRIKVHAVVAA